MIKKLGKTHKVLCTSRQYREVTRLAKMRKIRLILVGKHGGAEKDSKLKVSLERKIVLSKLIKKYSPNLTISFCSPDAARISYGLGIKHIAFCDSPHAEAVMRLSIPLVDRLLIPWIIPKREFTKYGITQNKIISYKAIDASIIVKNKTKTFKKVLKLDKKKTLLIRPYESEAAYAPKKEQKIHDALPVREHAAGHGVSESVAEYNAGSRGSVRGGTRTAVNDQRARREIAVNEVEAAVENFPTHAGSGVSSGAFDIVRTANHAGDVHILLIVTPPIDE